MKPSVLKWLHAIACNHDSCGKQNVVAAVVHKKYPVSIGYNSYVKSHPIQKQITKHDQKIYLHAEVDAVVKAMKLIDESELRHCDLYVYRVKRNGKLGLARPCNNCYEFVRNRLRNIYFTENE